MALNNCIVILISSVATTNMGVGRKISKGGGQWKKPKPKNSTNKPPLLYQWRIRGRTGHKLRAHQKGTLHQEPHIKSEDLFLEKLPFSENAYAPFEKISGIFVQKNFVLRCPLVLITHASYQPSKE